jgi:DNA polymerase III epsilon subunit-like protein
MESITWFAPILPGRLDEWKSLIEEIHGPREADHRRSRERMGLTREVVSHMETPQGDFVCLFHEGEDLARSFQEVANSDDPHDQWFREKIQAVHGITPDMLQGPLPATLQYDFKAG